MRVRRARPGPDHVGMKDGHEQIDILGIPSLGFAINDLFDLSDFIHDGSTSNLLLQRGSKELGSKRAQ